MDPGNYCALMIGHTLAKIYGSRHTSRNRPQRASSLTLWLDRQPYKQHLFGVRYFNYREGKVQEVVGHYGLQDDSK